MSADRTSGVIDADVDTARHQPTPDQTRSAKGPGTDNEVNAQPARDKDRQSGETSDEEPESNGETRSEATSDAPESTEVDGEKSTAKGYNGPFESREEEFAARRESRENVAAYHDSPDEKPDDGGGGSVQSVDKPVTGKTEHEAGQGEAESPATVEGVESPNAPAQKPVDRAASDSGQPDPAESEQDDRPPETPRPGSDGEQPPSVEKAGDGALSDADVETQPSADFGSPLPGEEHIPVTRAESRAQSVATNAELQNDEQDAGRTAQAVGQPTQDSIGGLDTADDAVIAAGTPGVPEQGEQVQARPDANDPTSHDATRVTESETGQVEADQGPAWPDHADSMKAEWAEHESRWPRESPPEGSPPDGESPDEGVRGGSAPADRPGDEPGSWRGDGGQYLNHEENYSAVRSYDRVVGEEPEVTDNLRRHEAEMDEAELVGLEYRLKGEERFKEKVAEKLAAELRKDPREAAESISDAVRYTYQIPNDKYVQGYLDITRRLGEQGHEMVFSRNSWDNLEYKGINTRWRTPQGQLFEVQFHTPESFEAKQLTHGAYERLRNPLTSGVEADELQAFQQKVSAGIPIPDNVSSISNYRRMDY